MTDNIVNNDKKTIVGGGKAVHFKDGNPGRQKGTPNKFTNLKDEFLKVFYDEDGIGGAEGMKKLMKNSPRIKLVFLQMISKMLPSNLTVDGDVHIIHDFKSIMTEFLEEHGTCTVGEFVTQLKSINGGGNGGGSQKLLAESIKTILPAKPD